MDDGTAALLAAVRDPGTDAGTLAAGWRALFAWDPVLAVSAAFDLLAGEPRIKPSRRLVVDPTDSVRRRWDVRVASAAALLGSPVADRVFDELRDELAEDADLADDVLSSAAPAAGLTAAQLAALRALRRAT